MDSQTLDQLRVQLEDERAGHVALLGQYGADPYDEAVRDLRISNDGFADSAQATEERSEILAQLEVARQRVHQIDAAIEQMDEGTYGTCVSCGREIQPERLEVRPLSVKCVECAAREG